MGNLKSFRTFSEERIRGVVITFGRFNPPTIGHEKLMNKVVSLASADAYRIYVSQSQDSKKNPLNYSDKIKFLRKMFPKLGRNIIEDASIKSIFDALVILYKQKFTQVTLVVGSDRIDEFKKQLSKYNGVEARHGFYYFADGINIVSSGERDPDSDDVSGMSASKMRAAAADNNLELFSKGLPKGFKFTTELFNAVRVGMGLKESRGKRKHIQLDTVSEKREEFVKGNLFKVGDEVKVNETLEEGVISAIGPNFVLVKTEAGSFRKWITAVTKINK